jgi:succinyl-diaminopimelate desuccinylase
MNLPEEARLPIDKEAVIRFTQKLVRCRSWNPPGDEAEVAALVAEQMEAFGMEVRLSQAAPKRNNVYGRLRGRGKDKGVLLLVSHLDTVPPGSKTWQRDPLSGDIANGRLHGRGSADMKAGLAAILFAAGALVGSAGHLDGDLLVAGTVGEEVDCLGAKQLVQDGILEGVSAIAIPEPSGSELFVAHKGALWVRISVKGRSAHGSRPDLGINAILHMNETIHRIMQADWDAPAHALLGHPTINVGTISGGTSTNIVPDLAEITIDFRTLPSQSHGQIVDKLSLILAGLRDQFPGYQAELQVINDRSAVSTDVDDPFIQAAQQAGRSLWNRELTPQGVTYYTDASVLAPACGKPVLIFGPGQAEQAHQTDEWVGTEDVYQAAKFYLELASNWLG